MAGEQGFEPWYAGIKIQCLNQLGDSPTQLAACSYNGDILSPIEAQAKFFIPICN
jgi:hypothetical protein